MHILWAKLGQVGSGNNEVHKINDETRPEWIQTSNPVVVLHIYLN